MTFWPLRAGRIVTSPFGQRDTEFHAGTDFGWPGGSANMPVYAIQSGTVIYAGSADGYGGDATGLAGWLVIDSDDAQGGGVFEYGHIRRLSSINVGATVTAGQQIAIINPDSNTNGGTAPHLHLSYMAGDYNPNQKSDPLPRLTGALEPPGGALTMKPDYNEYAVWSPNSQDRGGQKPTMFLLHTQEGAGNADSLARYLSNPANQVSYHYTISEDTRDHGVTVCDIVDTDRAAWSVMDYNNRSINLCFAGSAVGWSRAQWLAQSRAIDVAAYLAVQDCRKYGISMAVVPPPYARPPGISDHAYVTSRGVGTHTDVGLNFPWDAFAAAVTKYSGTAPAPVPAPADRLATLWNEWNAITFGDFDSIGALAAAAKAGDRRATAALAQLERLNPAALQSYINRKAA